MRRTLITLLAVALFGVFAQSALAAGGSYTFAGGTAQEQATVRAALNASAFDWSLIPSTITISIGAYGTSYSMYGHVYLDRSLLDSGRFAWGVVQHELGHQVDFFLLDDAKRQVLEQALGGKDWCYTVPGLKHSDYGCERFASELAWAYWPSPDNVMRPASPTDEAAGMPVAAFRALLAQLISAPGMADPPLGVTAFAPQTKPKASLAPTRVAKTTTGKVRTKVR
ncbi:MAG TPA: hypothetical protein VNC40_05115 [Gaiellaceae bacterium]|nr:hypothetical protein [Gaiellaceae bacterium]